MPVTDVESAFLICSDWPASNRGWSELERGPKRRRSALNANSTETTEYRRADGAIIEIRQNTMPDGGWVLTYTDISELKHREEAWIWLAKKPNGPMRRKPAFWRPPVTIYANPFSCPGSVRRSGRAGQQPGNRAANQTDRGFDRGHRYHAQRPAGHFQAGRRSGPSPYRSRGGGRPVQAVGDRINLMALIPSGSWWSGLFKRPETEHRSSIRETSNVLRMRPSPVIVQSDPAMLERILRNLISNALRYTQNGRVLVGARRLGDKLRIEVHDTGPGIPNDQLDNIFLEFHQLGNPERDRHQGLELGLAIISGWPPCWGIKSRFARVWGEVPVFSITLPIAQESASCLAASPAMIARRELQVVEY